jgi:hypothetical protein
VVRYGPTLPSTLGEASAGDADREDATLEELAARAQAPGLAMRHDPRLDVLPDPRAVSDYGDPLIDRDHDVTLRLAAPPARLARQNLVDDRSSGWAFACCCQIRGGRGPGTRRRMTSAWRDQIQ